MKRRHFKHIMKLAKANKFKSKGYKNYLSEDGSIQVFYDWPNKAVSVNGKHSEISEYQYKKFEEAVFDTEMDELL